jgi:hypothetical protein
MVVRYSGKSFITLAPVCLAHRGRPHPLHRGLIGGQNGGRKEQEGKDAFTRATFCGRKRIRQRQL